MIRKLMHAVDLIFTLAWLGLAGMWLLGGSTAEIRSIGFCVGVLGFTIFLGQAGKGE